jgi:hypothetical protein
MNMRSTARRFRAGLFFSVVASAMLLATGCSFESSASGLECSEEGASRSGEVCRDGYWRIVADVGLDSSGYTDVPTHQDVQGDVDSDSTPQDTGQDIRPDTVEDADGCTPRSDEAICREAGTCTDALSATNRCTGAERSVDCTPLFDFDTDLLHCGGCDIACPPAGPKASATCAAASCSITCEAGWVDVNDDPADGCESECTPTNNGNEICDGLDNDCDGVVDGADAADAETFYRDVDSDGYGDLDPAAEYRACRSSTGNPPMGYVADNTDCDDDDAAINPDADEVCDGLDNDCNGQSDENFADKGSACSVGQGACQNSGIYVCTMDGSGTECGASAGSSSAESCDGLDNDCDGMPDEDFADKGTSCTVGQGECEASGAYVCTQDGSTTECGAVAGTPAASETCGDGLDNDCNGQPDDGCQCDYDGDSDGVCANGTLDANGACQPPATYEAQEQSCDGLNNDCDGRTDEFVKEFLYHDADKDGFGNSAQGAAVCPGTPGYVSENRDCDDGDPLTYPGAQEICDGKDNNCNTIERDDRGSAASSWCQAHFNANSSLICDGDGPGGTVCCEYDGDPDATFDCDFETICEGGVDDDGDGATDCADTDCDGLSCASGKTCQSGSCQAI